MGQSRLTKPVKYRSSDNSAERGLRNRRQTAISNLVQASLRRQLMLCLIQKPEQAASTAACLLAKTHYRLSAHSATRLYAAITLQASVTPSIIRAARTSCSAK